jgi:hypothetical protein
VRARRILHRGVPKNLAETSLRSRGPSTLAPFFCNTLGLYLTSRL